MKKNTQSFILFSLLLSFLLLFTTPSRASEYLYNAKVEGMVCAFCAYSVSKNVSKLPGVDAGTVDVDLKAGHVAFRSSQTVDENKLAALFSESGFTISQLQSSVLEKKDGGADGGGDEKAPLKASLKIEIDRDKIVLYTKLLESLGDIAVNSNTQLLIEAPMADEDSLLKPLLMGRQQVVKVRFVNGSAGGGAKEDKSKENKIVIKLFTKG